MPTKKATAKQKAAAKKKAVAKKKAKKKVRVAAEPTTRTTRQASSQNATAVATQEAAVQLGMLGTAAAPVAAPVPKTLTPLELAKIARGRSWLTDEDGILVRCVFQYDKDNVMVWLHEEKGTKKKKNRLNAVLKKINDNVHNGLKVIDLGQLQTRVAHWVSLSRFLSLFLICVYLFISLLFHFCLTSFSIY